MRARIRGSRNRAPPRRPPPRQPPHRPRLPDAATRRPAVKAAAADTDAATLARGRYLAHAGDCAACHDAADHTPYAGGQPVNSPFGPIYAPNITPDPTHGIGHYTLQQFDDALRRGVRADGSRLYPAMPYPSFARLSADDVRALYAYFMRGVAPSANAAHATRLPFPFNQRWALALWRVAFASDARFEPQPSRSAEWNRGAYLVQETGHCGACHTPRGPGFNERGYDERSAAFLTGGINDHWFAPNLTGAAADGLGRWSADDIATFLRSGHAARGAVFGAMAPVVGESTALLTDADRHAIAVYLKSLPARPTAATNPLGVGTARLTAAGPRPEGGQQAPGPACMRDSVRAATARTAKACAITGRRSPTIRSCSRPIRPARSGSSSKARGRRRARTTRRRGCRPCAAR